MEGVAAASGVIAIASFALQLAETINEIVAFGKAVQGAPIRLRALFHDLEVLAAVISHIQHLIGHVAFDNVNENALRNCQTKISNLYKIIAQAQLRLKSKSRVRRKWGAFKISLQEDEIQSIQRSIEEAKLTLQLVQTKSLIELCLSNVDSHKQTLEGINHLASLVGQSGTQKSRIATHKIQVDSHKVVHPAFEATQETGITIGSANIDLGKTSSASVFNHYGGLGEATPFRKAARPFEFQTRDFQSSRRCDLNTGIFTLSIESRTSTVRTIRLSEVYETSEIEKTIIVYPTTAGRFLGITSAMLLSAQATSGWQYCIQTFRAVEESALVFEFCREGNLEGLRSLFRRKEASPWDRDPEGQTPLLIAARYLQSDVARFLLQEGADPHVTRWNYGSEPISAIALNQTVEIEPKLDMITLLQTFRREDYDDMTLGNMIWHVMLFYRPQKDIKISWMQRRASILRLLSIVLPFFDNDNPCRSEILHLAVLLSYEQEVLQYILRTSTGYIDHGESFDKSFSVIHKALEHRLLERDPNSMKLIVGKTQNLHRRVTTCYEGPQTETPTMLAMHDMKTFLAWRDMLRDLGHEITAFIDQELREGSLADDGWTASSLSEIFTTKQLPDPYYGPSIFGFPNCGRCGDQGPKISDRLKIDLVWRRFLRDIRLKHSKEKSSAGKAFRTASDNSSLRNATHVAREESSTSTTNQDWTCTGSRELPYRIVCPASCRDDVCVAWVYENETDIEPDLPPYPYKKPDVEEDMNHEGLAVMVKEDSCPTQRMPGAFKDV